MVRRHRVCRLLLTLAATTFCSGVAAAQLTIGFHADGPDYLTPNAPFTLARTTRVETRLQNGSNLTHEEHERLTRDARGRTFDLMTPVLSDPLAQPARSFLLADPVAHTITEWSSNRNLAFQTVIPAGARLELTALRQASIDRQKLPASVTTTTEDLGSEQIAGFTAKGTRTTLLIPANVVGNTTPIRYVTELWVSPDLDIPLRELDQNPLTGTRTMNTEKVEPNAGGDALFHLPAGLEVRTLKSPASPMASTAYDAERIAYNRALDDLKAPETREAAADIVVNYAQNHNDEAAHAALMLAIRRTHLPQAKTLAEGAVSRIELTTATLEPGSSGPSSSSNSSGFAEMISLAQAWDYLGAVYAASGDTARATRLFHSAWQLGGRAMTLDRLAQLEVHNNDKPAALQDDLMALDGELNARDTDEITRRAQRLGDAEPTPVADPESLVSVPNPHGLQGEARFDLLSGNGGKTVVNWVDGSPELKTLVTALTTMKLSATLPDAGPEHVLRQIHLSCPAQAACTAQFLYAWQADRPATAAPSHP